MTSKKRLVLFTSAETPEEPGPVKLTFEGEPPTDERWQDVTNYRRRLVLGGENQMLSLREIEFGPNVVVPRHRHDTDEAGLSERIRDLTGGQFETAHEYFTAMGQNLRDGRMRLVLFMITLSKHHGAAGSQSTLAHSQLRRWR